MTTQGSLEYLQHTWKDLWDLVAHKFLLPASLRYFISKSKSTTVIDDAFSDLLTFTETQYISTAFPVRTVQCQRLGLLTKLWPGVTHSDFAPMHVSYQRECLALQQVVRCHQSWLSLIREHQTPACCIETPKWRIFSSWTFDFNA